MRHALEHIAPMHTAAEQHRKSSMHQSSDLHDLPGSRVSMQTVSQTDVSLQVWLALLAAVIGTTFAYHLLNYTSPFGEFDTLRLRRSTQAANQVKTFVVESRAPLSDLNSFVRLRPPFVLLHDLGTPPTSMAFWVLETGSISPSCFTLDRRPLSWLMLAASASGALPHA